MPTSCQGSSCSGYAVVRDARYLPLALLLLGLAAMAHWPTHAIGIMVAVMVVCLPLILFGGES